MTRTSSSRQRPSSATARDFTMGLIKSESPQPRDASHQRFLSLFPNFTICTTGSCSRLQSTFAPDEKDVEKSSSAVSTWLSYSLDERVIQGKIFKRPADYTRHVRVHTGEKPYSCPAQGCNRSFAQKSGLETHINVHTGEKPFACQHCARRFGDRSACNRHVYYKHRVAGYAHWCPFYDVGCTTKNQRGPEIKVHLRKAHDCVLDDDFDLRQLWGRDRPLNTLRLMRRYIPASQMNPKLLHVVNQQDARAHLATIPLSPEMTPPVRDGRGSKRKRYDPCTKVTSRRRTTEPLLEPDWTGEEFPVFHNLQELEYPQAIQLPQLLISDDGFFGTLSDGEFSSDYGSYAPSESHSPRGYNYSQSPETVTPSIDPTFFEGSYFTQTMSRLQLSPAGSPHDRDLHLWFMGDAAQARSTASTPETLSQSLAPSPQQNSSDFWFQPSHHQGQYQPAHHFRGQCLPNAATGYPLYYPAQAA